MEAETSKETLESERLRFVIENAGQKRKQILERMSNYMQDNSDRMISTHSDFFMACVLEMCVSHTVITEELARKSGQMEVREEVTSLLRKVARSPSVAPLPQTVQEASWSTVLRRKRPTTGAAAPAAPVLYPLLPPTTARPGVLLFPTGENSSCDTRKAALKTADKPDSLGVRITGVRNGGIIVHLRTAEEAKTLLSAPGLKEAGLRAELAGARLPRVIIFNLPNNMTEPELRNAVHESTKEATGLAEPDSRIRQSHKAGPRNTGRCHYVIQCAASVRNALLKDDRLFMGWESFPVQEYVGILKCSKCHLYGHMAKACTSKEVTCGHCAMVVTIAKKIKPCSTYRTSVFIDGVLSFG